MVKELGFCDKLSILPYHYMYTVSIAKEVASQENGNGIGMLVIGMVVVVVGIVGFIMARNK